MDQKYFMTVLLSQPLPAVAGNQLKGRLVVFVLWGLRSQSRGKSSVREVFPHASMGSKECPSLNLVCCLMKGIKVLATRCASSRLPQDLLFASHIPPCLESCWGRRVHWPSPACYQTDLLPSCLLSQPN